MLKCEKVNSQHHLSTMLSVGEDTGNITFFLLELIFYSNLMHLSVLNSRIAGTRTLPSPQNCI